MPTLAPSVTPYYGGGQVVNPANVITVSGAPSTKALDNALGTLAVDHVAKNIYALVDKSGGTATWTILGGGTATLSSLTGNDGVVVNPTAGNINVVGTGVVASGISTAGNIYLSGSGSTLTIQETQAQFITNYNSTNIDHAHTPYVATATDYFISVDCSAGIVTVQLPNAPTTGRLFVVKDRTGNSQANNITVTTVGGVVLIDGSTTSLVEDNFESENYLFNGTTYETY